MSHKLHGPAGIQADSLDTVLRHSIDISMTLGK